MEKEEYRDLIDNLNEEIENLKDKINNLEIKVSVLEEELDMQHNINESLDDDLYSADVYIADLEKEYHDFSSIKGFTIKDGVFLSI